jgi:hypothetical protein
MTSSTLGRRHRTMSLQVMALVKIEESEQSLRDWKKIPISKTVSQEGTRVMKQAHPQKISEGSLPTLSR